jgi:hypothetical protein
MDTLKTTLENLQIPQYYLHHAKPTPHNTIVNKNKKWNKLIYPPENPSEYTSHTTTPQLYNRHHTQIQTTI